MPSVSPVQRLITLLLAAFFVLSSEPAHAFKTFSAVGGKIHQHISRAAVGKEMTEECFSLIDDGNTDQDLVPDYFFDERRHGDDNQIDASIEYIHEEFDAAVEMAGEADTDIQARNEALKGIGRMFHTLQDFYSHSNYLELQLKNNVPQENTKPILPFEEEWTLPEGLRTGYFDVTELGSRAAALAIIKNRYNDKGQPVSIPDNALYEKLRGKTFESAINYVTGSHEVLHHDLNKDNSSSPQGSLVDPKSGLTLFTIASTLAVEETERWWKHYLDVIRKTYGKRAPKIIAVLTGKEQPEPEKESEPVVAASPPPANVSFTALALDEKGVPVPNVSFELSGAAVAAITVAEGAARFNGNPLGNYTLKAKAPGFLPAEISFPLKETMEIVKGDETGVKITLNRIPVKKFNFTVSVMDEKGKLIPNTTIHLSGPAQAGMTTPMGALNFTDIPEGSYALKASAKGYLGAEKTVTVGASMTAVSLTLKKEPEKNITFLLSIVDEKGNLVPNVNLGLSGPSSASGVTPTGQMTFNSTPVGDYQIKATAKGFKDGQFAFTVSSEMPAQGNQRAVTFVLKKSNEKVNFVVLVFDQQGTPVPNVTINLTGPATVTATGPNGRADFSEFPSGDYVISLSAKGYKNEKMPLTVEPNMENIGGLNGISILMENNKPGPLQAAQASSSSVWDPFLGAWNGYARIVKSSNPDDVGQSFEAILKIVPYGNTYAIYVGSDMFGSPNGYRVSREGNTLTVAYQGPVIDTQGQTHGQAMDATVQLTIQGNVMTGGEWVRIHDENGTTSFTASLSFQKA